MLHQDQERIRVNVPYEPALIQKIRAITGARWSPEFRCWHVPKTAEVWRQLQQQFTDIQIVEPEAEAPPGPPLSPPPKMPASPLAARYAPDKISLLPFPEEKEYFGLHLPAGLVPAHLATVKNIHGRRWDPELKVWRIPYTQLTLRFLEKYFSAILVWTFQPADSIPERLAEAPKYTRPAKAKTPAARYEEAVTALEQCLTLKRYSWRTVKAYKNCFRQFIRHYDEIKPRQITRKQIDDYVAGLIREKHISESHQNQILSAIKMFYAEVVDQEEKVRNRLKTPSEPF